MSTKPEAKGKGRKKGKKEKPDKEKLTRVERTFYELEIADINKKIAHLNQYLAETGEAYVNVTETLHQLEDGRTDKTAVLERTLHERNDTVKVLEEQLDEVTKVHEQETLEFNNKIMDLEEKYKAMHDQLVSEIKLVTSKLNAIDEFLNERPQLLAKLDDYEKDLKEREYRHKETLIKLEQKAVVEKNNLKRDVESKMLKMSEDFTRSSESRSAGYTRRLIRENIALQKEIDVLMKSQNKIRAQLMEEDVQHKEMNKELRELDGITKELLRNVHNKSIIVAELTKNYEHMKTVHQNLLKYREMYEKLVNQEKCQYGKRMEMLIQLRALEQRIEVLSLDKNRLMVMEARHIGEIGRLRNIIKQIKETVEAAIEQSVSSGTEGVEEGEKELISKVVEEISIIPKKRPNLIGQLLRLICGGDERPVEELSISTPVSSVGSGFRPGKVGFLPRIKPSLLELYRTHKFRSTPEESELAYGDGADTKYIPEKRFVEYDIYDVEDGSTFYASSAHLNAPAEQEPAAEQQPDEEASSDVDDDGGSFDESETGSVISVSKKLSMTTTKTPDNVQLPTSQPSMPSEGASERETPTSMRTRSDPFDYDEEDEEISLNFY